MSANKGKDAMKAESTIQAQIRRLKRLSEDTAVYDTLRRRCYDAYHALIWVMEKTDWTPAGEAEKEHASGKCHLQERTP